MPRFRGSGHDKSKTQNPEVKYFDKYTPLLKKLTYGSEEYTQSLADLKPALDHHYSANHHHPEHHDQGICGMNLVDVIEMFCNWLALPERNIEKHVKQYNFSKQLIQILLNTVELFEEESTEEKGEQ